MSLKKYFLKCDFFLLFQRDVCFIDISVVNIISPCVSSENKSVYASRILLVFPDPLSSA